MFENERHNGNTGHKLIKHLMRISTIERVKKTPKLNKTNLKLSLDGTNNCILQSLETPT